MSVWKRMAGAWRGRGGAKPDYDQHLDFRLRQNPGNRDLAFAQAVGSATLELFVSQGDVQADILDYHGLADGMAIFDLGCGCGRAAQALMRRGWHGHYVGTDIIPRFVEELKRKCPGYEAFVHTEPTIPAPDASLDLLFHWSVFTHLAPEQCYLYTRDTFRALKPGGKLIFSFLELTEAAHHRVFFDRVRGYERGMVPTPLDTFLHRDWIRWWASDIGFCAPVFNDGLDGSKHPAAWQAVAMLQKPD